MAYYCNKEWYDAEGVVHQCFERKGHDCKGSDDTYHLCECGAHIV